MNKHIGEKLNASYNNRILAQDAHRLVQPFTKHDEHSCWQGEFWGKWFTSAVLAYNYHPTPQLIDKLRNTVYELMAAQTPEGYIGNYAPESRLKAWDIWGRKYVMLGLISYYDVSQDKKALNAAAKEADFLIKELNDKNALIVKMGNHRGMAASSVLEPVCQLYTRTGNKKYLDFAEEIVRQWETPDGPQLISKASVPVGKRFPKPEARNWYEWDQGQKAYEMMSCYEGLLELYRITGNETFKEAAQQTWQSILDTEINIAGSGAAMEAWFSGKEVQHVPIAHFQETCVTVTWIKFNQQLLRLTGDSKYADVIEWAYYNALLGSMRPDGSDWAKYTPLSGQRLQGSEQCGMGLNCCNASGPRGLFTIPLTTVMTSNDGVNVNFYIDGTYQAITPGKNSITVKQHTDYPASGKIDISLEMKKAENMTLALRIPSWNEKATVLVNEQPIENIESGDFLKINRNWKNGDKISIEFEMKGKLHYIGKNPENVAITRGPVVLTRDERLSGPELEAVIAPIKNNNGDIELTSKKSNNPDIWMLFSAKFLPEAYTEYGAEPVEVELCDYASAGNTMTTYPFFKVWMPQLVDPRK
ncbi:MAG: glycoside hydrolase family 127 protein [Bacteroidia bacterium]|nr:glycoside hydrolase family 127 protein [Bacteroidia bacterium]